MKNEYHITIESSDMTAVDHLALALSDANISRQKIKQVMQKGCAWLETKDTQGQPYINRLRRAKKILSQGDILHCYYDDKVLNTEPSPAILVSDESDYSIWNKPAGMLSQGSRWGDHCTINRWAEKHLKPERPAFIVHRLDRAASGLIILAHKKQVASQFSEMFQQHALKKHYQVTVDGCYEKSLKIINADIDGKTATSHILFLNYNADKNESLLDVDIETGRKHQIRKHLSGVGFPVVGDRLYGKTNENDKSGLMLQAISLTFLCPISHKIMSFSL